MQHHADVVLLDPDYLTNATIVTSSAVGITEQSVLTADDHGKIESSESVLIIGGGPTGVELAGEIAVDYPEKKRLWIINCPALSEKCQGEDRHKIAHIPKSKVQPKAQKIKVPQNQTQCIAV
ncbi:hypothetical protein E2562_035117 [Oryza meyeriana var. granulata]|uniref:FAD/NAD(P)-binding domain-containing protein n=1 Tax=Oryza meyeriana var. granulata TaxID=110450 RepID=A0A6G1FFF9_9ORYZ|nr:hypothetical protein E2562_035117 [Oryza meyeriana var. granulata]